VAKRLLTVIVSARWRASHKSYCICIPSHVSAVLPNTFSNRIAMSGETGVRGFLRRVGEPEKLGSNSC
jgi:hypothetical protein